MDDNKYIHIDKLAIYTDGSCLGNPGSGGWCYILNAENRNNKIIDHNGVKNTTNNRMELQAFLEALKRIEKIRSIDENTNITVYSDSQYLINMFNKGWIYKWSANDWCKTSKGKLVKNKDIVEQLYYLAIKYKNMKFIWIKGHSNNELNNLCDEKARESAELIKK